MVLRNLNEVFYIYLAHLLPIQFLVQNFLELQRYEWSKESTVTLADTVRRIGSEMLGQLVVYVYQEGLANTPLEKVLRFLKLIA